MRPRQGRLQRRRQAGPRRHRQVEPGAERGERLRLHHILLGRGDGLFDPPSRIALPRTPNDRPAFAYGLVARDFDATRSSTWSPSPTSCARFASTRATARSPTPSCLTVQAGDVDGDEVLDIVATGPFGTCGEWVLVRGTRGGAFKVPDSNDCIRGAVTPATYRIKRFGENVAPDLNADGRDDLLFFGPGNTFERGRGDLRRRRSVLPKDVGDGDHGIVIEQADVADARAKVHEPRRASVR